LTRGDLALVLSGGGARAAYQVGVLRGVARVLPDLAPPILTGTSAGAINVAQLANHTGSFPEKVEDLRKLWLEIETSQVFETAGPSLLARAFRIGMRAVFSRAKAVPRTQGMVDTEPLRVFLTRAYGAAEGHLPGIAENLSRGGLKAVALTTLRYATGQTVTFFSGQDISAWERPNRISVHANLGVEHVMASAALPLFFPAVSIGGTFYGDGGIRLVSPLAPALHLGASRMLVISTRHTRSREEAARPSFSGPPSPAQVLGVLYSAIFLDGLEEDVLVLQRINHLVRFLPPEERGALREVGALVIRPSRDIGALAGDYEPQLPGAFRFLTRRLGTQRSRTQEFLSTVMFQSDYVRTLMEIGEEDAEARREEIGELLAD
jgi:NTE family protein